MCIIAPVFDIRSMAPQTILTIILAITIIGYVFDQFLDYINLKAQRTDIPKDIESFYERDKYLKALSYHSERTKFSFLTSAVSFLLSAFMLWFGGFGWLDSILRLYISNDILLALVFFGALILVSDILTIPFQWYSTFVIEEKYGFNKTTLKTFITDKLKGYVLASVIGGLLLTALLYLVQTIGSDFWIWFSIIAAVFILLINMFYTALILPLFNKLTPLPDGELKTAIEAFSKKVS